MLEVHILVLINSDTRFIQAKVQNITILIYQFIYAHIKGIGHLHYIQII